MLGVDGAVVVGRDVDTLGVVGASELGPCLPGVVVWQPATSTPAASAHTTTRALIAVKATQPQVGRPGVTRREFLGTKPRLPAVDLFDKLSESDSSMA